jgi:hypothetical protein
MLYTEFLSSLSAIPTTQKAFTDALKSKSYFSRAEEKSVLSELNTVSENSAEIWFIFASTIINTEKQFTDKNLYLIYLGVALFLGLAETVEKQAELKNMPVSQEKFNEVVFDFAATLVAKYRYEPGKVSSFLISLD